MAGTLYIQLIDQPHCAEFSAIFSIFLVFVVASSRASYCGYLIVTCHNQDHHVAHDVHDDDHVLNVGIDIGKLRWLASLL